MMSKKHLPSRLHLNNASEIQFLREDTSQSLCLLLEDLAEHGADTSPPHDHQQTSDNAWAIPSNRLRSSAESHERGESNTAPGNTGCTLQETGHCSCKRARESLGDLFPESDCMSTAGANSGRGFEYRFADNDVDNNGFAVSADQLHVAHFDDALLNRKSERTLRSLTPNSTAQGGSAEGGLPWHSLVDAVYAQQSVSGNGAVRSMHDSSAMGSIFMEDQYGINAPMMYLESEPSEAGADDDIAAANFNKRSSRKKLKRLKNKADGENAGPHGQSSQNSTRRGFKFVNSPDDSRFNDYTACYGKSCSVCGETTFSVVEGCDYIYDPDEFEKRECKHWSLIEEVMLVGLVCHINDSRLSFKPTENALMEARRHGRDSSKLIWQELKDMYQTAVMRYFQLSGEKLAFRSVHALERHLKELKKRLRSASVENRGLPGSHLAADLVPFFRPYRDEFERGYNPNYILTCPEKRFEILKRKLVNAARKHKPCKKVLDQCKRERSN